MKKYYDEKLPITVNVTYGERRVGVTYRETEKLINENKMLREAWDDMFHKWETQVNRIAKAIEYIEKNTEYLDYEKGEVFECEGYRSNRVPIIRTSGLLEILKGEEK